MMAYTKEVMSDPETAWRAAITLRDSILALGYELRNECEIGAISEEGPAFDAPVRQWRGHVDLVFATR